MAVAGHVFDKTPAPPALKQAQMYQRWGVADITKLPAGLPERLTVCLNVHNACAGYLAAGGKTVAWTRANPQAWNLVSWIIAERKRGNRTK